jgi:RNA polymerase sigma-70 factor (ECF subfamily)
MLDKSKSFFERNHLQTIPMPSDFTIEEFSNIYNLHAPQIYAHLLRLTGCRTAAEDLMQETFLKAYKRMETFRGGCSVKTWLFAIAFNTYRDYARKIQPNKTVDVEDFDTTPDMKDSAQETLEKNQIIQRLRAALANLPDHLLAPLMLVRFDGLRYQEAAETLGTTTDAVRMRVHRAHRALAEALMDVT